MKAATDTAQRYRRFAHREAREHSPQYAALSEAVSNDPLLLRWLDELPVDRRQPNLLFAAARFLGGPVDPPTSFRSWAHEQWAQLSRTMLERRTQTNEAGRCAVLLPVLAALPQRLALVEVGAAAGLCLHPDRYRYRYDDRSPIGPSGSAVVLPCATSGPMTPPQGVPRVSWRAGIDLPPRPDGPGRRPLAGVPGLAGAAGAP